MSKQKKHKKKRRRNLYRVWIPPITAQDRHHICFQKRNWNKGYAKAICMAFVRYVPVVYHRELHAKLKSVPLPPPEMLRNAWMEYNKDKDEIDGYDVARAAAWLYVHIPDAEFRAAMQCQIDFFVTRPYTGKT